MAVSDYIDKHVFEDLLLNLKIARPSGKIGFLFPMHVAQSVH